MIVRWADGIRIRSVGNLALFQRGEETTDCLSLPVELARILCSLLVTPSSLSALHLALRQSNGGASAEFILTELIDKNILKQLPLAERLAALHRETLEAGSEAPVVFEVARMLRECSPAGAVHLPSVQPPDAPLMETLSRRRTQREFSGTPLSLSVIATLLTWGAGHGDRRRAPPLPLVGWSPAGPRTYPSGGGLYPVELLVWPLRVDGLDSSRCYCYQALAETLVPFSRPDGREIAACFHPDNPIDKAGALFLFFVDFSRTSFEKYGAKMYRLATLEAGHMAQNILLVAAGLGLAGAPLCGFHDQAIATTAGLDFPYQVIVYTVAIGGMIHAE